MIPVIFQGQLEDVEIKIEVTVKAWLLCLVVKGASVCLESSHYPHNNACQIGQNTFGIGFERPQRKYEHARRICS